MTATSTGLEIKFDLLVDEIKLINIKLNEIKGLLGTPNDPLKKIRQWVKADQKLE